MLLLRPGDCRGMDIGIRFQEGQAITQSGGVGRESNPKVGQYLFFPSNMDNPLRLGKPKESVRLRCSDSGARGGG